MMKRVCSKIIRSMKIATHNVVRINAPVFIVATGNRSCRKCKSETRIHAIIISSPSRSFNEIDPRQEPGYFAVLSYVEDVSDGIAIYFKGAMPGYFLDDTPQWRPRPFWMNHCENCRSKVSDFDIIESTIAPLKPATIGARGMSLTPIAKPLQAKAVLHRQKLRRATPELLAILATGRNG